MKKIKMMNCTARLQIFAHVPTRSLCSNRLQACYAPTTKNDAAIKKSDVYDSYRSECAGHLPPLSSPFFLPLHPLATLVVFGHAVLPWGSSFF